MSMDEFEGRLIELERKAIDEAYRQQITFLFQIWMKDPSGQPERALRGVKQAREAYIEAMAAIDQRAQE